MRQKRFFLGETTDRDEAFPDIVSLDLTIKQDLFGFYTRDGKPQISKFTKNNVPSNLRCINPRCQQGGVELQNIVLYWNSGKHELKCNGHEGSPQGRRIG